MFQSSHGYRRHSTRAKNDVSWLVFFTSCFAALAKYALKNILINQQ